MGTRISEDMPQMGSAKIMIPELKQLIIHFSKNTYTAKAADSMSQDIIQKCVNLIDIDYKYSIIYNTGGDLCSQYPSHLIILEKEKFNPLLYKGPNFIDMPVSPPFSEEDLLNKRANINKLKNLMKKANYARCRLRFPLPVIMYEGKHICRSATLSGGVEIYGRSGLDYLLPGENNEETEQEVDETEQEVDETEQKVDETEQKVDETEQKVDETEQKVDETEQKVDETEQKVDKTELSSQWKLFDEVRNKDIKLLKTLNVGIIIDLMVEKKKVKYKLPVTSSEKVDKFNRYSDFSIISLPYPGCEFFKEFRENNYVGDNLIFDWSQTYVDAKLQVPEDTISSQLQIDWDHYQQWDILVLTQNYLKLILRYVSESSNGILIHCISGWDRTPLFISLLRLSLWADNVIHTSLNAYEMLYYTIAYDWMLFGHDLQDRLNKGEEIFFFCFYFLKYICDEDFSIKKDFNKCDNKSSPSNDDEIKHPIFDMEAATGDPSISASGSDSNKNSRASRDDVDSQYSSADLIWTVSPPNTEEFSNSDSQTVQPTFTMEPATGDASINASSSDSNRNWGASRDDKNRELTFSEILWPDSPPKTKEFDNSDLEFEHIFPMELETESPSVSSSNSNRNSRASKDDKDEQPKIICTWNRPPETKEFSNRKVPSLLSSPNKKETTHESSVPHGQTSPVPVPRCQQTESTTPDGSWQIVTKTGSLDDFTMTEQLRIKQSTSSTINKPSDPINMCKSLTGREIISSMREFCSTSRKDKLYGLRNAFYTAYSQTGFRMKKNSERGNLVQILDTISGVFSSQSTTL